MFVKSTGRELQQTEFDNAIANLQHYTTPDNVNSYFTPRQPELSFTQSLSYFLTCSKPVKMSLTNEQVTNKVTEMQNQIIKVLSSPDVEDKLASVFNTSITVIENVNYQLEHHYPKVDLIQIDKVLDIVERAQKNTKSTDIFQSLRKKLKKIGTSLTNTASQINKFFEAIKKNQ